MFISATITCFAPLAELVDARDSKSRSFGSICSTQIWGTIRITVKLSKYKRIIIKVGSAVIARPDGKVNQKILSAICNDILWLRNCKIQVLLVSSGAISLGRKNIMLPNTLRLSESQALASHGQIELMAAWKKHFNNHSINIGQMLLTPAELKLKTSSNYAIQTMNKLLELNLIPIINENDSTATDEIKFGDNDLLAAKIAKLFKANLLIMLSTVEGLYKEKDEINSNQSLIINKISKIDSKIRKMANDKDISGKGGMKSKLLAAEACMQNKCDVVIGSGLHPNPIKRIFKENTATWFRK
jgi:glutamate 5-kinase